MKSKLKYFGYNLLCWVLPRQFYRVSVKALIWNEDKTKLLLLQEANGKWEIPGGALDWGENAEEGIAREVREETGFEVLSVNPSPICFVTCPHHKFNGWFGNVVYEVTVKSTENIVISDECVATGWYTSAETVTLTLALNNVRAIGEALVKMGK
jgi:ADP-ribose pyrophosphatase YjhB (NUDIX family)